MTRTFTLSLLVLLCACSIGPIQGDRKLSAYYVPDFLRDYTTRNLEHLEFFAKTHGKTTTYEAKYLEQGAEKSVTYSDSGVLLETELDTSFDQLETSVQEKIKSHLEKTYPGFKVLEVEKRTDAKKREFIDVEVRHPSSKSGYWELAFDPAGEFVSREVEDYQVLNTLN